MVSGDLLTRLHDAAAQPTGDVPLSAIERRLRSRRDRRRAGAALAACALVAGVISVFTLSGGNGPSVETVHPAAQANGLSVDLPPGWTQSDGTGARLAVGTVSIPAGVGLSPCRGVTDPSTPSDDAFVQVAALGDGIPFELGGNLDFATRPADFALAPPVYQAACTDSGTTLLAHFAAYAFRQGPDILVAVVTIGEAAPESLQPEAYAVLNSLRGDGTTQITEIPLPPTSPSTIPPSDDTRAIEAAYSTWLNTVPRDDPAIGAVIEDYDAIKASIEQGAARAPLPLEGYHGQVDSVVRIDGDRADVIYSILNGDAVIFSTSGKAVKVDGVWRVSRDTVCAALEVGGTHCPPRD